MKWHLIATVQTFCLEEPVKNRTKILDNICDIEVSGNLKKEAYKQPDGMFTLVGIHSFQASVINGLAASTFYGKSKGWLDPREQYRKIQSELQSAFLAYENKEILTAPAMIEGAPDVKAKPPQKSTDKELVIELVQRNRDGKYDEIIHMAVSRFFHDFKAPDDAPAGEKMFLCSLLARFPELSDIRNDVMEGLYDEAPDDEDTAALSKLFQKDAETLSNMTDEQKAALRKFNHQKPPNQ